MIGRAGATSTAWPTGLLQAQGQPLPLGTLPVQPYSVLVGICLLLVTGLFVWGWLRTRSGLSGPLPLLKSWARQVAALVEDW